MDALLILVTTMLHKHTHTNTHTQTHIHTFSCCKCMVMAIWKQSHTQIHRTVSQKVKCIAISHNANTAVTQHYTASYICIDRNRKLRQFPIPTSLTVTLPPLRPLLTLHTHSHSYIYIYIYTHILLNIHILLYIYVHIYIILVGWWRFKSTQHLRSY